MQKITQNHTTNITDELKSLKYVDLIHELANTGVSFKSHRIKLVNADNYLADNKCSICLEEYDNKERVEMLGCNHIFQLWKMHLLFG